MGFTAEQATSALQAANGDLDLAVELLLQQSEAEPVPEGDGFAVTSYKRLYERSSRIEFQDEILRALRCFLQLAVPQDKYKEFFQVFTHSFYWNITSNDFSYNI